MRHQIKNDKTLALEKVNSSDFLIYYMIYLHSLRLGILSFCYFKGGGYEMKLVIGSVYKNAIYEGVQKGISFNLYLFTDKKTKNTIGIKTSLSEKELEKELEKRLRILHSL